MTSSVFGANSGSSIVAAVGARAVAVPPPVLTNRPVLNIVGAGRIGRMPNDLLQAMVANRSAAYTGPSPLAWGLTD